ncbi:MAG: DUF3177 family protein [Salinivenus sp.]
MPTYETLVRMDFLAAVGLLVVVPLILLLVSVPRPWVRDRLLAYWRASALLGITVYLLIGERSIGFLTGIAARSVIPVVLWWGDVLSQYPGRHEPTTEGWHAVLFRGWRMIATVYTAGGLLYMLPLLSCLWISPATMCNTWYIPPQEYAQLVHPYTPWSDLALYGTVALAVYLIYAAATAYHFWVATDFSGQPPGQSANIP